MTDFTDEILKHAHKVEARANALADDMARELEAVRARLLGRLAVVSEKLGADWENAALKRRKAVLDLQRAEVEKILAEVYREKIPEHLKEAVQDTMEATASTTTKAMNKAAGISVKLGHGITKKQIEAWFETSTVEGLLINDWLGKLEKAAADRIISVGRQSLIEGLGVDATARLMRTKGIEGSVPGLRGLASTFLQSASHHARERSFEAFGDAIIGFQHVGTLDRRTCVRCGALDGKFYNKRETRPILPLHWRCRCLYVPVTSRETPGGDRPAVVHSGRKVHHRDGSTSTKWTVEAADQVPASTTYQSWLKRQLDEDPAFVRSVLGKTRFELFKSGKLTINSMVSNGRIKKLSELR